MKIELMSPKTISAKSQIIRGTMSFSREKLNEIDPSYTGYTQIFVLDMPRFLSDSKSPAESKMHAENLKAILEFASTSYNGTPDLAINTSEVNVGYGDRNVAVPLLAAYDSTSFTIKCLETRTEPLRHAVEHYVTGLSDPYAKYTHLHGSELEPTLENITMKIMVVQTDQTLNKIQDISLWQAAFPTGVQRDQLNWDQGNVEIVQAQDVQFRGVHFADVAKNNDLFAKAKALLTTRLTYYKKLSDITL